jgi:hypothetical protein
MVNEPGARACRECGKWPSLFNLQDSVVEDAELEGLQEPEFEVEQFEPETFEPEIFEPDREARADSDPEPDPRRRRLISAIWPIALIVYLVISFLSER